LEQRQFEVKIEQGACAANTLPLSCDNQTTTSFQNPHTGSTECLGHTPGSHSVGSVRTLSQSNCLELVPHVGIKKIEMF